MSLIGMRSWMHGKKHALPVILGIGTLAILLPVFFSGFGNNKNTPVNTVEQQRTDALADRSQVVAKAGQEDITRGQMDDAMDRMAGGQPVSPMQRHQMAPQVLDTLTSQAIMMDAAKKQGLTVSQSEVDQEIDKDVHARAEQQGVYQLPKEQQAGYEDQIRAGFNADDMRNSLLTRKLADKLKKNVSTTSPGLGPNDIEVNARHILIAYKGSQSAAPTVTRTKDAAKALADQLAVKAKANPSGFAALADQNTDDPSGKGQGGNLNWFNRQQMVKPFADAAFAAKPGAVVGPVETPFGFHVIKVEDRRVAEARANQEIQKFLDVEKKKTKPVMVAADLKALDAYQEYNKANAGKDKSAAAAKRQAAIAAYEAASKARPKDPALYMMLGQLYSDAQDNSKALAAYQQAAALPPPTGEVHLALGDLYRKQKQNQKALDEYKLAGRLSGSDMMTHIRLQTAYHDMGQADLAKAQSEWLTNMQRQQQQGQPQTIPGG